MKIVKVKHLIDYKLEVVFDDEKKVNCDFSNFLEKQKNPMTKQFLNISKFKKVEIENGHLTWLNGQMDISAESIYNEEFSQK